MSEMGSSTTFQSQVAHFRAYPPIPGIIAASHRSTANLLLRDEARRMAANFAELPELLRRYRLKDGADKHTYPRRTNVFRFCGVLFALAP